MKFLTSKQIREADQFTISNEPVSSVDLMERAAMQCTRWILNMFSKKDKFVFFAGPGNNGGDAWAIARQLVENDYLNVRFFLLDISGKISPDSEVNRERLKKTGKVEIISVKTENDFPVIEKDEVIIDGLFGSGLTRQLEGLPASLVRFINNSTKKCIISIDIPSGLFGEESVTDRQRAIVKAGYTLTFQFPKLSFFMTENEDYCGEWIVLSIGLHPEFIKNVNTPYHYLAEDEIRNMVKMRKKFSHKGTFGHGLLIAGSYGMMGAAVLASRAAIKSGIGLVTAHIPRLGYDILQTTVPEALTCMDISDVMISECNGSEKYDAVAFGPGVGQKPNTLHALENLLEDFSGKLIIDADGLNLISKHKDLLDSLPENTVLTPHPKEFGRLFGESYFAIERLEKQMENSKKYRCYIILKGAYTSISTPEGELFFNTTGNAGMATGGSGDVLTGILLSLLSQGYDTQSACKIGVYLHGLAGDIAAENESMEAVSASDIINSTGQAFKKIKHHD